MKQRTEQTYAPILIERSGRRRPKGWYETKRRLRKIKRASKQRNRR